MSLETFTDHTTLKYIGQAREKLVEYCDERRFAVAQVYLIQSGLKAAAYTGLWTFLARRAQAGGNEVVAHAVRSALWDANVRSGQIAIQEARYYLAQGNFGSAAFVIDTVFGQRTQDSEARLLVARCEVARILAEPAGVERKLSRDDVGDLLKDLPFITAEEAMTVIDLLRFAGYFERALVRLDQAQTKYPNDIRFLLRRARILEQTGDIGGAIEIWEDAVVHSERYRIEGRFKLLSLYGQLGREGEVDRIALDLSSAPLRLVDRLRLAFLKRQSGVVEALIECLSNAGPMHDALSHADLIEISDMLLDHGCVGLLLWLRKRRVLVSDKVKSILDQAGYYVDGPRVVPASFQAARQVRSPDFLFPLDSFLEQDPRPAGWPGTVRMPCRIMLVNASLKAGGAERQFVELCRALVEAGTDPTLIDVALYSLAADRGHSIFLDQLTRLGVNVFDLSERPVANRTLPPSIQTMIEALPQELSKDTEPLWHLVQERRPKVLHCWQDRAMLSGGLVGIAANLERVVLSARNMSPATRGEGSMTELRGLYSQFAGEPNFILTSNSMAGTRDYEDWLGLDRGSWSILANSIDLSRFHPGVRTKTRKRDEIYVTGVFRLAANKRPLLWVETLAELQRLSDKKIVARIFGEGPLLQEIWAKSKEVGLENFQIEVAAHDPEELYAEADIVLLMSRVEGVPNVVLEAQACGIPVVACDVGGTAEALHQGGTGGGLLLDRDVEPYAAAQEVLNWLPDALAAALEDRVGFVAQKFGSSVFAGAALALYTGDAS